MDYNKLHNKLRNVSEKRYNFLIFYYFVIEWLCKRYFDRLIFSAISSSEKMINLFERNGFGIDKKRNSFVKMDIIEKDSYYDTLNKNKLISTLEEEFEKLFKDELKDSNINIDIDTYVEVSVELGEINLQRIFTIQIEYYRNKQFFEKRTRFIWTLVLSLVLIMSIIILITLI